MSLNHHIWLCRFLLQRPCLASIIGRLRLQVGIVIFISEVQGPKWNCVQPFQHQTNQCEATNHCHCEMAWDLKCPLGFQRWDSVRWFQVARLCFCSQSQGSHQIAEIRACLEKTKQLIWMLSANSIKVLKLKHRWASLQTETEKPNNECKKKPSHSSDGSERSKIHCPIKTSQKE